jgi:thymidylate synthase
MAISKTQNGVEAIRRQFLQMYQDKEYVTDKSGVKMLEIHGASFMADEDAIFGIPDKDYIAREIQWYESESLNVKDIPGKIPQIWLDVSSFDGKINSNYGFLILSRDNGNQFVNVLNELRRFPESRRAVMIYTRPSMHREATRDGMSDFICTNAVQYVLRNGRIDAIVQMRSNDVVFGYRNDLAWQRHVLRELVDAYNDISALDPENNETVLIGDIIWQVGSLHVYERHFPMIQKCLDERQARVSYISEWPEPKLYDPKKFSVILCQVAGGPPTELSGLGRLKNRVASTTVWSNLEAELKGESI